jgi:L-threonylcarbamoyladenylate synthase
VNHWQVREAARALRAGGVIAYPTETVYGLGCDPLDPHAIERILELKQRPQEKGLILIGADLAQLLPFIDVRDQTLLNKLTQTTTRPTTWICPLRTNVPRWLCGKHHTLAVRITTNPIAQQLCQQFGSAIVSTSANPAGLKPARSMLAVRRYFGDQLDYVLNGTSDVSAQPSRIVDLISGNLIRQ